MPRTCCSSTRQSTCTKQRIAEWLRPILRIAECHRSALFPTEFVSASTQQMTHCVENSAQSAIRGELDAFIVSAKRAENEKKSDVPSLLSLFMAPSLNRRRWRESIEALCANLSYPRIARFHDAAALFLSMADPSAVFACIEMYCAVGFFAEALAVARHHLLGAHPMLRTVLCRFAEHAQSKQRTVLAAKCFVKASRESRFLRPAM